MNSKKHLKNSKPLMAILFLAAFALPNASFAQDLKIGANMGIGGAGIKQTQTTADATINAEKSEGPGVFTFFIESIVSDESSMGFEHSRGFRFGPFSSGISFNGFTHRWHFMGSAPNFPKNSPGENYVFLKQYSPYVGYAVGIATAEISRKNDQISGASGSGAYVGFKFGTDYSLKPGRGIRYEMHYATTIMSAESPPTVISEFALQIGWYIFY